ncbi:MAG: transporter substrate-binding domain-containing protein, partial [Chloroflexota bacterium]|nr:transporter substrate-binding domain-containing protein [Chloroflexota bacterium]
MPLSSRLHRNAQLASFVLLVTLLFSACIPAAPTATNVPAATPAAEAAPAASEPSNRDSIANSTRVVHSLPDLTGRTVVAVTANDFTPLNFVDPQTGEAVGMEYDIVNEICRRLNCQVEWQNAAWEGMIAAIAGGQFDVGMDGITITDERKQQVDFSIPYLTSQQFMLVRGAEDRFATPQEFSDNADLLIGAQAGTTGFYTAVYDVLDGDEANPRIQLFDNFGASVQALIAGDVDMVLASAATGAGYIGANPDQLKLVGDALVTEDLGFIFTPGSE